MNYYSKLFPSLFKKNVIIVLTRFIATEEEKRRREMQDIDVNQIIADVVKEVRRNAGLQYDPKLFTIDCLSVTELERENNIMVRDDIYDYIGNSLTPVVTENMTLAKTVFLKNMDSDSISKLRGEITAYKEWLVQSEGGAADVLKKMERREQEIISKKMEIHSLESQLKKLNSSDLEVVAHWSVNESRFLSFSKEFCLISPCDIEREHISLSPGEGCKFEDISVQGKREVRGKVVRGFNRRLSARVSIEVPKKVVHREAIQVLKAQIAEAKENYQSLIEFSEEAPEYQKAYEDQTVLLKEYVDERSKKIDKLLREYLTLDEARERLRSIQTSSR